MKLFVSKFNIVFLILFLISIPALSGQLHVWVDENGVTHMTSQPPPADAESETIKYKDQKNTYQPSRDNFEYLRKMESRRNKNTRLIEINRESERVEKEYEKRKIKDEIADAKEDYEDAKEWGSYYREKYNDASSDWGREHYREKMKEAKQEADEAYSKYRKLINK